jgi:hypothetical protein
LVLGGTSDLPAQQLEARLGVLLSTPLARDLGASASLIQRIPANYRGPVSLELAPAPVATVGLVHGLAARTSLELMGSVAVSKLDAQSADVEWHTQDVSLAAVALSVRYQYMQRINLHGGIGLTRFFSESTGIFNAGSDVLPLIELGASTMVLVGALPVRGGARLQTHTFGTPALRRAGATNGRVGRLLIQVGIGG